MIKKILSFGFLSLCFGLVFLTQPKTADAACSYNITRMDSQSSVTSTGSLNINYAVKRSGTSGDCQNTPRFNFYAHASYDQFVSAGEGGTMVHFDTIDLKQITAQFNGDTAQGSFSYSLSGFPWCNLSNKNSLSLFMRVYDGGPVATSGDWNVNVTGTTCTQGGTGGAKTLTLNFDRASYNKGDYIDVFATLSNTSGAKDVEMVTYVGSQVVGSFQVSAAALSTPQKQRVTVGTGTGFVDGTNTIKVAMYEAGSNRNLLYAQGTASVQAAGLGTTAGTGGGTGGTGTGGTGGTGGGTGGTGTGGTGGTGGGTGGGAGAGDTLINPLPIDNLTGMFLYIVKGFLGIIGIWGVLFVIIGGFRMVMAAGNEEQYLAAKKTITWAILGVLVAVMSFSIIAIVQNLVGVDYTKIQNAQPPK